MAVRRWLGWIVRMFAGVSGAHVGRHRGRHVPPAPVQGGRAVLPAENRLQTHAFVL